MRKYAAAALRVFLLTFVALAIYVKVFEHSLIFYPDRAVAGSSTAPFEDVFFSASDGTRLHAWWLPETNSRRVLIVSHGNAGNISYRGAMGDFLRRELGMNVLMYDYRGYGRSEGTPSEAGTYSDIRGAFAYARSRGFEAASVFLMGQSLGTAVTVDLAAAESVGGVILEAPFTSIAEMASHMFFSLPLGYLIATKYDSLSKIGRIRAPLAVIHATGDPVVPYALGRRLFDAATAPKAFFEIQGDSHEGAMMELDSEQIQRLLDLILNGLPTGSSS